MKERAEGSEEQKVVESVLRGIPEPKRSELLEVFGRIIYMLLLTPKAKLPEEDFVQINQDIDLLYNELGRKLLSRKSFGRHLIHLICMNDLEIDLSEVFRVRYHVTIDLENTHPITRLFGNIYEPIWLYSNNEYPKKRFFLTKSEWYKIFAEEVGGVERLSFSDTSKELYLVLMSIFPHEMSFDIGHMDKKDPTYQRSAEITMEEVLDEIMEEFGKAGKKVLQGLVSCHYKRIRTMPYDESRIGPVFSGKMKFDKKGESNE